MGHHRILATCGGGTTVSTQKKKDDYVPNETFIDHMRIVAQHVSNWSASKKTIVQSTITGSTTVVHIGKKSALESTPLKLRESAKK